MTLLTGVELEGYVAAHPDEVRDALRSNGIPATRRRDTVVEFQDKVKLTYDGSLNFTNWDSPRGDSLFAREDSLFNSRCSVNCKYLEYSSFADGEEYYDCALDKCIYETPDQLYGVEIVLPPAYYDEQADKLRTIYDILEQYGWQVDHSCGTHIHIDGRELSTLLKISRFIGVMSVVEREFIFRLPVERRNSHHAAQMEPGIAVLGTLPTSVLAPQGHNMSLLKGALYGDLHYDPCDSKYDTARYRGLNLHSKFYRNTVEFRYLPGYYDVEKVIAAIYAFERIVARTPYNIHYLPELQQFVELIDLKGFDEALKEVFSIYDLSFLEEDLVSPSTKGYYRYNYKDNILSAKGE